ncbi:hypothetical protein GCM10011392_12940 [Wenxinia marina]|nr:hypothetical protein GCM10011392_12940 [Wenxinia marina]
MIGLVLGRADDGAQRVAVLRRGSSEVGDGDGDVVEAADHGRTPAGRGDGMARSVSPCNRGWVRHFAAGGVVKEAFILFC